MLNFFYLNKKKNQKLNFYLQNYYGLGSLSVQLICKTLGYDINIRITQLSERD
jgi:ribosomal protein S13